MAGGGVGDLKPNEPQKSELFKFANCREPSLRETSWVCSWTFLDQPQALKSSN